MFRGTSFHTLDSKGRIIIPSRFREIIRNTENDGVVISRMDGTLYAYTSEEWKKIEHKILSLAEKTESMRRFRRVFIGAAFECFCDKNDRILIPPTLRQYAGLEKDMVLVGALDHFEIWSLGNWNKELEQLETDSKKEEVRNEIAKLGI
ncbi:MAG: division/cell wall cluster transcriptional repressor MraZ [Desulfobacterium sp.]|nr:division/cell wall cluster transcriptional repressor MraZ [Desulfobacterium sp.]MBU3949265.1 division/cell wall cluster transcriptional repressor MraZ [Pseudomonadota bacterium]MBU4010627.1 division/cell wall cluster transcriptional repressor MraZ [Pseudomonadota bacterium]MBU4035996.1 division/cell wall cluster transcriptional repressor MraZ [Pseudomonadota bacterium]